MSQQHRGRHRWTAGWMLFLGLLATLIGATGVLEWERIASALRGYYVISLVVGMALLASGAMGVTTRPPRRWVLVPGLIAALALGINQGIGLWFSIIPCFSPG
jgi:hypothetical protein